jgi:chromosome segregation ATPase
MTVFNAAKDRDNAKKAKDKAVADKEKAAKEKNEAVKAKGLAEKQRAEMEKKAAASEAAAAAETKKAAALKSEAASEMKKAKDLYSQQINLNRAYHEAVSDRDSFKAKADKANELAEGLDAAYVSIGAMAKAVSSLLCDPDLKIDSLTPVQERVLQAVRNYAVTWAEKAGFTDVADDIRKYYGISKGIQSHIDELTPKPHKRRSYDMGL